MAQWTLRTTAVLGLMLSAWSCRADDPAPAPTDTAARKPAAAMGQHWIHDERLRGVMADLNLRMRENYPTGLPDDPEQATPPDISRDLADAAKLADVLAETAQRIPRAIDGSTKISDEDRAGFLAEANTLREHALQLKAAANDRRIEGMQRSLMGINATCIACHSKYKDISGELSSPRSARSTLDTFMSLVAR